MANNADAIDLMNEVEQLKARIDAALALHTETEREGGLLCVCGWSWRDGSCQSPTVKALKGEA